MKRQTLPVILFTSILVFSGCSGEKKIDASSDESMRDSISKVKESLSPEQKEKFEQAVMALLFAGVDGENLFLMAADSDGASRRLKDRLDGKTALEIIAEADKIIQQRDAEKRKKIAAEISELLEKKALADEAREKLKLFQVFHAEFHYPDTGHGYRRPVMYLKIANGLDQAVSHAYCHGLLATPGRSVPWVSADFNFSISGGLEPGEEMTTKLEPNRFGKWGEAPQERTDMVFAVSVLRVDGADGKPILNSRFSEYDNERLMELQAELETNTL